MSNTYYTRDVAERHGKSAARIRQIAAEYGLGTVKELGGVFVREFNDSDVCKIAAILAEKGRLSKNSKNMAQSS